LNADGAVNDDDERKQLLVVAVRSNNFCGDVIIFIGFDFNLLLC